MTMAAMTTGTILSMKTIYCVQLNIQWEDKQANYRRVETLLEATPPERGSLVLLPEMFATGFSMNGSGVREGRERPTEQFLSELSRRWGIYLTAGVVGDAPRGRGRNQSVT